MSIRLLMSIGYISISAFLILFCLSAKATSYRFNQDRFEILLEKSEPVFDLEKVSHSYPIHSESDDDATELQRIAGIVALAEWGTGIGVLIPIHRIILGCDGSEVRVSALYCITLGGCGWLPLIDGIAILTDQTGKRYIENPKFLMWAGPAAQPSSGDTFTSFSISK